MTAVWVSAVTAVTAFFQQGRTSNFTNREFHLINFLLLLSKQETFFFVSKHFLGGDLQQTWVTRSRRSLFWLIVEVTAVSWKLLIWKWWKRRTVKSVTQLHRRSAFSSWLHHVQSVHLKDSLFSLSYYLFPEKEHEKQCWNVLCIPTLLLFYESLWKWLVLHVFVGFFLNYPLRNFVAILEIFSLYSVFAQMQQLA